MQSKLANLKKGEVSAVNSQRSEENRTQKAINTLEYKLDRVSHEMQPQEILWIQNVTLYIHIIYNYYKLFFIMFAYVLYSLQASTHFSEQLTKNGELRKELQSLHIERVRFQQLQKRLEKVRHQVKKKL